MKWMFLCAGLMCGVLTGCDCMCGHEDREAPATQGALSEHHGATSSQSAAPTMSGGMAGMANSAAVSQEVDSVSPGNQAQEEAHAQKGAESETGDYAERTYRHALNGWFSWDLKVLPNQPNELWITYWGGDAGRTFDILIDGNKFASEVVEEGHPESFFEKKHPLPIELTRGKQKVTVRFQSQTPEGYAGGVFGVRTMRAGAVK